MKKSILLIGVLGILLLSSCATTKVKFDYDKSVDFTKFKTYEYFGWAENSDKILNQFDKDRIENAFGMEFKKRDMKHVETGGDLIVTLYIVTEKKTQTTATTTSMGGGYGGYYGYGPRYGWGTGMSHSTTTYNDYDDVVGTLVIDVYDAKNESI